ncbi:hypothetical protein ABFS82_11G020700 [Erythranthe guttata]|uniref:ABSCISIC ACID-INSENSITIVE 5-like protein 2 n=1 Tax=Erythranthe guttata TaxID=4155 RepID=UPI00064DBAB1|nr:PREDICTED: ABSCISIC ACID-INSENSITIVE 5-like protein 2 [Erythranthe guttata]|eukprot:XP_012857453.1 PREDICTED: ABSCISIC ACID-INSENSITIVE 5-like protein 2 [Erythranthe guttata]
MVAQRMRSQGVCNNRSEETQTQTPTQTQTQTRIHDPKSNPLARQGSLYSLTLDEVQNQLGDLGKPLNSMNLDELLKTVWTAETNNHTAEGVDYTQSPHHQPAQVSFLNRQSRDLSKKTVDEVWQDIQEGQKRDSLDRTVTLGEITLEDFLVKAGIVAESPLGKKNTGSVDPIGLPPQQAQQWMNYSIPSLHPPPPQQLPVYMPGHQQQPIPVMENVYSENQMGSMCSSPLMGTQSDTQMPRRKRIASGEIVEKTVERRQKRMIKNRESAARSRARKQAYTHELENKVSRLEEENERLKRQQEWEKVLPSIPPPEPKYQLRRTSSSPI